jgi:hypothetical protein
MTTYFIYSAMGYMGDEVGDFFAKIETEKSLGNKLNKGIKKELGNIDVYVFDERANKWMYRAGFNETGPIAINRQIIPLCIANSGPTMKIKLVLNKGFWRIDYAALANIKRRVTPLEINPSSILNKGVLDERALREIRSPDRPLISMPGSRYTFNFRLPRADTEYEMFLCSRGYYLEWMRERWIKDKDPVKLKQMVDEPKNYLQEEARNYKRYEATMEQEFWGSKIDSRSFSLYEK